MRIVLIPLLFGVAVVIAMMLFAVRGHEPTPVGPALTTSVLLP